MLPDFLRGKCRNCGSPVSCFALRCPACHGFNQPNPAATIVALAGAFALGGVIALGARQSPQRNASGTTATQGDSSPRAEGGTSGEVEYGWLVQAMEGCDEQAKKNTDSLHFLIVPMTPTGLPTPGWSPDPISEIGRSAKLLSSSDALKGLRRHALALYQKPLTFQVEDPKTRTVYKWKPSIGVAALNTADAGLDSLKLGFEIPDLADVVEWSPVIKISNDKCYWINVLVPASGSK
jgi:hypothetical protein